MTRHKLTVCAAGLEMVTNPAVIVANETSPYVMTAFGNGVGSTGYRIWDTNLIPSSSSGTLLAGQTLTLPISSNHLPPALFDAIVVVTVNNQTLPIGVSNSPDNNGVYSASQPVIDKIIFWTDLLRTNTYDAFTSINSYRTFCDSSNFIPSNYVPKIYFSEPTPAVTTFNVSISFVKTVFDPSPPLPMTFTVTAAAGVNSVNLLNNVQYASLPPLTESSGHWKISITTNDNRYRSVLPFYHWGGYLPY